MEAAAKAGARACPARAIHIVDNGVAAEGAENVIQLRLSLPDAKGKYVRGKNDRAASADTSHANGFSEKPKQVADKLRRDIVDGRLDEGDSLGTEAELVERFEVSRPTLREALRILEAEGLITVVRGVLGGVTVHRPDQRHGQARAAALVLQSRNVDLADVFDASAIIEPAAARSVATSRGRASAAKELRAIISEEKRAIDDVVAFAMPRFVFMRKS